MQIDIEAIKTLVSIEEILTDEGITLKQGRCRCPLHNGDNPASFSFNEHAFHCFSCGASGDTISLVQKLHNLDFRAAVIYLGRKAGILDCETEAKKVNIQPVIPDTEKLLEKEIEDSIIFLERVFIRLLRKCDRDLKEGRMSLANYYSRIHNLDHQLEELDQLKLGRNLMKQKKMRDDAVQRGNKRNLLKAN